MKSNQPDIKIYATAHHKETIQEAYREGLIENNDLLPLSAFSDCDYIFYVPQFNGTSHICVS